MATTAEDSVEEVLDLIVAGEFDTVEEEEVEVAGGVVYVVIGTVLKCWQKRVVQKQLAT